VYISDIAYIFKCQNDFQTENYLPHSIIVLRK